jgi:hypothetical protein
MLVRLTALLLGSFLAVTNNAIAEPMVMPIVLQCDTQPGKMISMVQEQYEEQPFFTGQGIFMGGDSRWNDALILSTANPRSGTFSIIMIDPQSGAECMLMVGNKLAPASR